MASVSGLAIRCQFVVVCWQRQLNGAKQCCHSKARDKRRVHRIIGHILCSSYLSVAYVACARACAAGE
jgi:hypothetical protein